MYFQHNILEAGAHWADFPWWPINCLQDTGFPEPPPYVNKKRIFMAEAFYDVTHWVRRELHRAYICQCLDTLGDNRNVLFLTGEEFTGPLAFVQFWLDTIDAWQKEKGKKVLIGLSCTKDVQDAILADPVRGPKISVIDMKYWCTRLTAACMLPKAARTWRCGNSCVNGRATSLDLPCRRPGKFVTIARSTRTRRFSARSSRQTAGLSWPRAARSPICLRGGTRGFWRPCHG